ncbi:MAG: tetraacyldisaccharide 4'-kinase [Sulfurospirillum sp.]
MFDKASLISWVEEYLFYPKTFLQFLLSFFLLPLTFLYCIVVISKRVFSKKRDFKTPIISVGNLTLGGSGKTPLTIELAKDIDNCAIILRGYKRASKGLVLVSKFGKILCDVSQSGDEAMLCAKSLPNAAVIVSENRIKAIEYAKSLTCRVIFLDDAFSKAYIKKFDILIKPYSEPTLPFCLPSGSYREPKSLYATADLVAKEDIDFKRVVKIKNPTENMLLITGISKPQRLDIYLPKNLIKKIYFEDHHCFTKEELNSLVQKYNATSILTTQKDAVKMDNFGLNLSVMELKLELKPEIKEKINTFLANFR